MREEPNITLEALVEKHVELEERQLKLEAKLNEITHDVGTIKDDFSELKQEFSSLSSEVMKMMGIVQTAWQSIISQNSRLIDSMSEFQKTTIDHNNRVEEMQKNSVATRTAYRQQQVWSVTAKVFGAGGILGAGGIVGVLISQYFN